MAKRYPALTERQVEVLQWIADGCQRGVWTDSTYKLSANALANRGLVTITRRRGSWSAAITENGQYYLDHGEYLLQNSTHPPKPDPDRAAPSTTVTATSLISELQTHGGALTLTSPSGQLRSEYLRAVRGAATQGTVPEGFSLRYSGRSRGDLVIRLVAIGSTTTPSPNVPVPETLENLHDVVRAIRDDDAEVLDVGEESRSRALLILQAIADECYRRGYTLAFRREEEPTTTFRIRVEEILFDFMLTEEFTTRDEIDDESLANAKYDWQRVPAHSTRVRSGRLKLQLKRSYDATAHEYVQGMSWADRSRWTLDDKLPQLFAYIEKEARRVGAQRQAAEKRLNELEQRWQHDVDRARNEYIDRFNRRRLELQANNAATADSIRSYVTKLRQLASELTDSEAITRVSTWADWAAAEAETLDPLSHLEELRHVMPAHISPSDLQPFMCPGMDAKGPPEEWRYRFFFPPEG